MQTKLTLRMEESLVRQAKRYAARSGRSVSRLVADFFALIESAAGAETAELSPRVQSLVGALATHDISEDDYRRYLRQKHG